MKEIVVTKDVKTSTNLDKGIFDVFYLQTFQKVLCSILDFQIYFTNMLKNPLK